jgi:hypothetical protein
MKQYSSDMYMKSRFRKLIWPTTHTNWVWSLYLLIWSLLMQFKPVGRAQTAAPMAGFLHPLLNEKTQWWSHWRCSWEGTSLPFDFLISSINSTRNSALNNFQVVSILAYIDDKDSLSSACDFYNRFLVFAYLASIFDVLVMIWSLVFISLGGNFIYPPQLKQGWCSLLALVSFVCGSEIAGYPSSLLFCVWIWNSRCYLL